MFFFPFVLNQATFSEINKQIHEVRAVLFCFIMLFRYSMVTGVTFVLQRRKSKRECAQNID